VAAQAAAGIVVLGAARPGPLAPWGAAAPRWLMGLLVAGSAELPGAAVSQGAPRAAGPPAGSAAP